jgi:penicillin amidase
MRIIPFFVYAAITTGLIIILSIGIGSNPPLGKLLSPSHGFWKNAEPANQSFSVDVPVPSLLQQVTVSLDDRLVPHVFAQNDHDAYLVQGYLHAKFRLWQMEFETYAAAGRLSEILGEKLGANSLLELHDRKFRRLGMTYAAENTLSALQNDPVAKAAVDAYTDGVNLYVKSLKPEDYPIEYKLLNYAPEAWTPLKSLLILKYMSYDLTTDFDDFEATDLLKELGLKEFENLNPLQHDSVSPIAPKGTVFTASRPLPVKPAKADSVISADTALVAIRTEHRDPDNGSNNWVVSGKKTKSKRPILCDDMHLSLNLPSLWYEIQLTTPEYSVYGVSLPGTPFVIVGFNDSIAWGVTNASRDVMDFYEIKFKDSSRNEYWYDSAWQKSAWRVDTIKVKGKPDFIDSVAVSVWGPVMYDDHYESPLKNRKAYAVKWTAHEKSDGDLKTFLLLNRAKNYDEYTAAIKNFGNPGQNFVFGSKTDDIAIYQAGRFPAKWKYQGDFVLPGTDSTFKWQGYIPFDDLVHQKNPERGFASSANQLPADTSYPYYLGGSYDLYRGFIINRFLAADSNITVEDMQQMQTSTYDVFSEMALPVLLKYVDESALSATAKLYLEPLKTWNNNAGADENAKTIFENWWQRFVDTVYNDDLVSKFGDGLPSQADQTLLEGLKRDSTAYKYIDNKNTPAIETLQSLLAATLNTTAEKLGANPEAWGDYKGGQIIHLLRIPAFSVLNLHIGGGRRIINAVKGANGPSWRMIVHLTDETEAYGVYPGGQNGNPGSKYYSQFASTWATGKYYRLWFMKAGEISSGKAAHTMHFKRA